MTVSELIERLKAYPGDFDVKYSLAQDEDGDVFVDAIVPTAPSVPEFDQLNKFSTKQ